MQIFGGMLMLNRSTIQLLRFPFSLFLAPVFFFALSEVGPIHWGRTFLVFLILHLLVYPASNGYNSYMDRDESPIGGLATPLQPTKQLFHFTLAMDLLAILLGFGVSISFSFGVLLYILASRSYSFRGIRLKKFPVPAYITVIFFQGAVTFALVYHGCSADKTLNIPLLPMISASLLIGGFYPLTQVYQHKADQEDGVQSISMRLGYRGTFIFCAVIFSLAMGCMGLHYYQTDQLNQFLLLTTLLLPVLVYFMKWAIQVWRDLSAANFNNTMRMNVVASVCTSIAFIIITIWKQFE
jgi:1,4-dihydroxy-2-naphthoate polyprenyltransferase